MRPPDHFSCLFKMGTIVQRYKLQQWTACVFKISKKFSSSHSPTKNDQEDLLIRSINGKGLLILNRPNRHNALTLDMTRQLAKILKEWENSKQFVIITGAGDKAFSSGGDLKEFTNSDNDARKYHSIEGYQLNDQVSNYPTPYISLMNGIAFGQGIGLSIYGSHRVATEKTMIAMPEVAVGFFPDVGASYFLPRLLGGKTKLGIFLALTGYRLTASDVWHVGVATHMCRSEMLTALQSELLAIDPSVSRPTAEIDGILQKYHDQCPEITRVPFRLANYLDKIDRIFNANCVEEIVVRLKKEAESCTWCADRLSDLLASSPTSLKVTFKLYQMGVGRSLKECLTNDDRVTRRLPKTHDFEEGITSKFVEKRKPQWNPSTLDQVTESMVDSLCLP